MKGPTTLQLARSVRRQHHRSAGAPIAKPLTYPQPPVAAVSRSQAAPSVVGFFHSGLVAGRLLPSTPSMQQQALSSTNSSSTANGRDG
jgi:hypothetical protein